ncbi:cilia- and flagella-associated protein 91 isoform X1 [Hippoglossus hippoglossus]|uniref:cilia- and flagella-associated protein 91 isoform X1 n=1 Tax=Hippoglossus hippoglossus TaxID=8267 RepID=UPI00148E219D|nr:cilia- and flagella-associated protein 91 isoform X1 [Hippoglossus hippoglossus]
MKMNESVSVTVSRKKPSDTVVKRQRVYDFLYDPVHTVSSEVDHVRSRVSLHRVRRVPDFGSMFSSLPHHPGYTLQLDPADPVPASVDRGWRGYRDQHSGALQQLTGAIPRRDESHRGADRWKYFKRPLLTSTQRLPPDVIYGLQQENFVTAGGQYAAQQPTHVTVGVQTDYRENETQTDPYCPEYVIRPGTTPTELLQLAPLTWGRGLPAGLAEVEMIERARAKRVWEASLPPLDDLSQLDKRRRMMEEMEAREWAFREEEIQKLQESRLVVLTELLRQRDEAQRDFTDQRLTHSYFKLLNHRQGKLHKTHNHYTRSLRKLQAKGRNMKGQLKQLGLKDSEFVPHSLRGTFNSAHSSAPKKHHLNTYEGLNDFEARSSTSICQLRLKRSKDVIKDVIQPSVKKALEQMNTYKALREKKTEKPLRFLIKKEKPVPRPATPIVEEPPEGDEETELAVVHLQKLLRGKSVQNEMFKGKENHMDLIQELRTVHALQRQEQQLQETDRELMITLKKQRDKQRIKTSQNEASQARVIGAELEDMFDTLSKELIRLQEERRIHAFTLLAERERRTREAEESGRRQLEEHRRREEDEIFRQVVEIHQETVDFYLESVILGSVEQTADDQAREEIRRRAKEINDIVYAAEKSRNKLQSEEIVSELVYSFLIPEVEKINIRRRVHARQQKHLQAVRSIINEAAEGSGIPPSSTPSLLPSSPPSLLPSETASVEEMSRQEQDQRQEAEPQPH